MTKSAATAAARCTAIMLQEILDHLSLRDVLHAMAVNRLWREHVINHPTYYSKLYLFPHDPPTYADLFLLRLSRSAGRPVLIVVQRDDLHPFLPEIANHLVHIYSLTLRQSSGPSRQFVTALEALCKPADILLDLCLEALDSPSQLPSDFLAGHAPALRGVHMRNISFPGAIPRCFSGITSLKFSCDGLNGLILTLPNPFERCPNLRWLWLTNCVTLDDAACRAQLSWERMLGLCFTGRYIATRWPTFGLSIAAVPTITTLFGTAASVLALADTISGALDVTFAPLRRPAIRFRPVDGVPFAFYAAVLRSMSAADGRLRRLEGQLGENCCISAFSLPTLANRIARITLALSAWNDYVGLRTFGSFGALEELVLTLTGNTEFPSKAGLPKLSCPRLQRLVLSGQEGDQVTVLSGAIESFAVGAFSRAKFPLRLELIGIDVTGEWNQCLQIFSSCVPRFR